MSQQGTGSLDILSLAYIVGLTARSNAQHVLHTLAKGSPLNFCSS
jgi:hypothetical protein